MSLQLRGCARDTVIGERRVLAGRSPLRTVLVSSAAVQFAIRVVFYGGSLASPILLSNKPASARRLPDGLRGTISASVVFLAPVMLAHHVSAIAERQGVL